MTPKKNKVLSLIRTFVECQVEESSANHCSAYETQPTHHGDRGSVTSLGCEISVDTLLKLPRPSIKIPHQALADGGLHPAHSL